MATVAAVSAFPPSTEIKYWPPPTCPGCQNAAIIKVSGPNSKNPGRKFFTCNNWSKDDPDGKCNSVFQWADETRAEAEAKKAASGGNKKRGGPYKGGGGSSGGDAAVIAKLNYLEVILLAIANKVGAGYVPDNGVGVPEPQSEGDGEGSTPDPPTKKPCFK